MLETIYICSNPKCRAEDYDRSNNPPLVLNCWRCGAGRARDISTMLSEGIGMFPKEK